MQYMIFEVAALFVLTLLARGAWREYQTWRIVRRRLRALKERNR